MAEDPEGWDRAHPKATPTAPHPIVPGCRCDPTRRLLDWDCPTHGIEAEQRAYKREAESDSHTLRERKKGAAALEEPLLMGMLELAVPGWIERIRRLSWSERMIRRDTCLRILCTGEGGKGDGDILGGVARLVCGEPGKGVAEAFNALAESLALGALQPGGITFGGRHWEAVDRAA